MPDPKLVNVTADGRVYAIPEHEVEDALRQGYQLESPDAKYDRLTAERLEDEYGGVAGKVAAGGAAILRGATVGLSDAALGALGEEDDFRNLREVNPGVSTAGEIIGGAGAALAGVGPAGAVSKLGASVARTAEGAGTAAKLGRAVAGGAAEGAITGAGAAVSELALSEDPLTIEHMASALASNALFGATVGGGVGGVAKGAEIGLKKAKKAIDEYAAKRAAAGGDVPDVADDLAGLDTKQLRAARDAELANIEAARVPQRQAVADDLGAFRAETKESKLWLATKDAKEREIREIGKLSLEADRALDRVLRNPKNLASNPRVALAGLQQQEHALELLVKKADDLRVKFAADKSGERLAALDAIPGALERNRKLQASIGDLTAPPSSPRLVAIDDAKDAVKMGAREKTLPEQMLAGSVFSAATGAASMLGPLAPLVGAKAAKFVSEKVFGRLGRAADEAAAKTARVASSFFDAASKGVAAAPVVATRVLASVAFAPSQERARGASPARKTSKTPALADVYKKRSEELRSQTMYAPDGSVVMRPEARAAMAERLAPIRAANPLLADRLETQAAKRMEYVASRLPRRPDMGVMAIGEDLWQPSDMEMRTFARVVAAAEDPASVEERLLDGTLTPEDAECYRTLYPERFADLRNQIISRVGELRATLPYERRLSLSIFTGVPVDPAMHPQVLAMLQGSFAAEEGTAGGTQAPTPQPQFGSVRAEPGTPAQQREQGATA